MVVGSFEMELKLFMDCYHYQGRGGRYSVAWRGTAWAAEEATKRGKFSTKELPSTIPIYPLLTIGEERSEANFQSAIT